MDYSTLGPLERFESNGQTATLYSSGAKLSITALAPDLVHLRFVPPRAGGPAGLPAGAGGAGPLDSFAVVRRDWPACPIRWSEGDAVVRVVVGGDAPAGGRGAGAGAPIRPVGAGNPVRAADALHPADSGDASGGGAGNGLTVEITRRPLRVAIRRTDGTWAAGCAPGGGFVWQAGRTGWRLAAPGGLRYYGFGQKLGPLDKRGRRLTMWTTDEPYHTPDRDELYQAIPFFLTLDSDGKSAGVFVDCPARVTFDVAKSEPDVCWIEAAAPVLDAYVFTGPSPKDVIVRYTELTGRMELPPRWALGYHQSRWSYAPEAKVREIARELRNRDIPCDAIHLDIDYMDGYRVFTWDRQRFPDPKGLVADLAADGFRTVVIVDPGVKLDPEYRVFQEGVAGGHFIQRPDGELFVGEVWPGTTVFPDFLRAQTRAWWGKLHRELVQDVGVAGIWTDMNEPSCFARKTLPDDVLQGEDGERVPHGAVHNVYGLLMAQATYEALGRLAPDRRPFVLTRSGYAGVQRYAAVWMGDNHSWWEHLLAAVSLCLGMGLSGVPFVGTDIGGFQGDCDGELLARWTQAGAFMPFCRNHSCQGTREQEPWRFGPKVEAICREYLQLRYRLLPFWYNEFRRASETGLPIMRPLFLEYPGDPDTHCISDQFLLGQDVLVCPVYQPGATHRMVYLPEGQWVDFWSGRRHPGPGRIVAEAPLERMPVYVRDGAIIPMAPGRTPDGRPIAHTGQLDGRELILNVYAGRPGSLELYEDAGEGYGYRAGEFAVTRVDLERNGSRLRLAVSPPEGAFPVSREAVTVHLYAGAPVVDVRVDGRPASTETGPAGATVVRVATPGAGGFELTATVGY
ncbi:MAG: DUF5110 domain-containing protein [Firmicutes bacterium]|nr:DUF5110 domain-containing protein [Bacillota bacterium]